MESRESLDIDIIRYLLMFKRQWLTATLVFSMTVVLSLVATTFLKNKYQASGTLLFRRPTFEVSGSGNSNLQSLSKGNPINNQIQLIQSSGFLQEISDKLQLKDSKGEPLPGKEVGKSLTLKIVPGTDVLRISYMNRDPKMAARVVNTIMDLYLANEIKFSNSEAVVTRQFLNSQLPRKLNDVNTAASQLRRFKQENQVTNLAEEMKFIIVDIGKINIQISTNKAQIRDLNAQRQEIERQLTINNEKVVDITSLSQSESIQQILKKIQEVDIDLAQEKSRFYDNTGV